MHEQSEAEKHCNTKITVTMDELRILWSGEHITDKVRMEMIKSIIWCAPDMEGFYQKVLKELDPKKFERTLD